MRETGGQMVLDTRVDSLMQDLQRKLASSQDNHAVSLRDASSVARVEEFTNDCDEFPRGRKRRRTKPCYLA